MIFLRLFYEFFKTGLFSIGGGMATVPFLQDMAVGTGWFTSGELADMIAVAESTPGPLGVNMATYVGYSAVMGMYHNAGAGILGAVLATLSLIAPSVIVITIISYVLDKFKNSRYVAAAFYGLRPASVGLIAAAGVNIVLLALFGIDGIFNIFSVRFRPGQLILAIAVLIGTRWIPGLKKLHPICFIAFSAIFGILCL